LVERALTEAQFAIDIPKVVEVNADELESVLKLLASITSLSQQVQTAYASRA